jgi:peptidyl-prolyl cis-trans isomerase C
MPAIVRHILVADRALADTLKQQLAQGADFAALARRHSTCPSGRKGGELGEVKKGQLVAPVDRVVFTQPEHTVQGPVKSRFGWHLIEVKFRY